MSNSLFRSVTGFFALLSLIALPQVSLAATKKATKKTQSFQQMMYNPNKRYKDEKIDIKNPTTRCVTATTKASHQKSLAAANEDGLKYSVTTSTATTHGEAFRTYLTDLDMAWDAMLEPYCGFGAFGTTAAVKSYTKSVERARTRFLEAVKKPSKPKELVVAAPVVATPVASVELATSTVVIAPMSAPVATSSVTFVEIPAAVSTPAPLSIVPSEPVITSSTPILFVQPVTAAPSVQVVSVSSIQTRPNLFPELWSW